MQTPVRKMIESVEQSLKLNTSLNEEQKKMWEEIKAKFTCYEQDFIEEEKQKYNEQASQVLKENRRLKWLLSVVADHSLERGE